jgi:hypothetical protein
MNCTVPRISAPPLALKQATLDVYYEEEWPASGGSQ